MVGTTRIELVTPAMSTQCSTTELRAHAVRLLGGHDGRCKRVRHMRVDLPVTSACFGDVIPPVGETV